MENYPKVSILIPTYNRCHFLIEALESSLKQNYPNFEVIISDNASTDETEALIKEYLHDPRVKYYRNDRNLGSGENYRRLLYDYATGEYGKYLTDDDCLMGTEHLSKSVELFMAHQLKIVFAAPFSKYENESNGKSLSLGLDEIVPREWWLKNICRRRFGLTYFPPCASGYIFDIAYAKNLDAFNGLPFGDYEFAIKCLLKETFTGYLKDIHYLERRHSQQDGVSSFGNAIRGTMIFDRAYHYGCDFLDESLMTKIKRRGYRFFTQAFLMPNWIKAHGNSLNSFLRFLSVLRKFDPFLPLYVLMDMNILVQFVISQSAHSGRLKLFAREIRSLINH